ncbi:hypothetical protein LTR37_013399 [Vermiconidia calcicola]|uniref:Uncharacterized protein n=1 Tax=Vermiconidia calcicola TaxID=1690605 RepID=A0ACC3MZD7_9PEZI|nr:hypothetical protein LTR37_013399 [Vermiconidia calcicola]
MEFEILEPHGCSFEETNNALQEERKAMVQVLYKQGLLLELPESVLDRTVGPKDSAKVYEHLINKSMRSPRPTHFTTFAHSTRERIEKLSAMPDGLLTAMGLLVDAAAGFVEDYMEDETDSCVEGVEDVLWPMGDLMAGFIQMMYREARINKRR